MVRFQHCAVNIELNDKYRIISKLAIELAEFNPLDIKLCYLYSWNFIGEAPRARSQCCKWKSGVIYKQKKKSSVHCMINSKTL